MGLNDQQGAGKQPLHAQKLRLGGGDASALTLQYDGVILGLKLNFAS